MVDKESIEEAAQEESLIREEEAVDVTPPDPTIDPIIVESIGGDHPQHEISSGKGIHCHPFLHYPCYSSLCILMC